MFTEKIKTILFSAVLLVLFYIFVTYGSSAGKKQAESKLIASQAAELNKSLENFYSDNSRFPSADEFARTEVMSNYLSRVPKESDMAVPGCPQIFSYQRPDPKSYTLNFCLPASIGNFKSGWNTFSLQK
jgi:hypothetical protein